MQIAFQMAITHPNFTIYMCVAEVGVLFSLVLYYPAQTLHILYDNFYPLRTDYVTRAYQAHPHVPYFASTADAAAVLLRLPFWASFNKHVR